jgi:hypothetical protein
VRILLLGLLGLVLGMLGGGLAGLGLGLAWTAAFDTSCFEGECAMLVFFVFLPAGAILGALVGAVGLGYLAARRRAAEG